MKYFFLLALLFLGLILFAQQKKNYPYLRISAGALKDKIQGGWAGQTIGVTFGGPYEFQFNGTFIQDYQPLDWHDGYLKATMQNNPGLYDDIYMDLTFVDVFEKYGLDAPLDSFANAYAHAGYMLWHANQAGRYNILNGIRAPQSGHWMNNPHADDIDYQIESDFAGLMSPAMPNTASAISDKIGHIMNYGDGWYGGVFVGAMYTLAFTSSNIRYIVEEALKTIPVQSDFYKCINDVINWHHQYPGDWHQTWFAIQKKWSSEVGCPDGVFDAFDIDAKINAAYVVLGLLYGNGDFGKTLEITARAGQDADCNPSTTGGILGAMLGYDQIPAYWKMGLKEAENIDFKYTTMSLEKVYAISYKHALVNIQRNGGRKDGGYVFIRTQKPTPVRFEKSFPDIHPIKKQTLWNNNDTEGRIEFEGTGFVLRGEAVKKAGSVDAVLEIEISIDGKKTEIVKLPTNYTTRRHELCWKYGLSKDKHVVEVKWLNPSDGYSLHTQSYIVYNTHN